MARKETKPRLSREQALDAIPVRAEIAARKQLHDGSERITFRVAPGKLHRTLLRLPDRVERAYEFDSFGLEVLNRCDGGTTVRQIVDHFVERHKLDPHEAEKAVVTFFRTLMQRGIISMLAGTSS